MNLEKDYFRDEEMLEFAKDVLSSVDGDKESNGNFP